jgi:hypothetical protein
VPRLRSRIGLVAVAAVVVIGGWFGLLLILDAVYGAHQAHTIASHIGESLQATATIDDADLALVRGRLSLDRLAIRRDDVIGHLSIDVAEIRCELAPIGWALVDHDCRELAIKGMRLDVSTAALFKIKNPKRKPISARHVVIDDAELAFAPSAFLPSLGRIAIKIDHAEAGPTVFRTPLSFIFSLVALRARVELPAGLTLVLDYHDGRIGAAGSLFGSTPVEVPLTLPVASTLAEAHDEIVALVKLGTDLAEELVAKRAEDWLRKL